MFIADINLTEIINEGEKDNSTIENREWYKPLSNRWFYPRLAEKQIMVQKSMAKNSSITHKTGHLTNKEVS